MERVALGKRQGQVIAPGSPAPVARTPLRFRAVNAPGTPGYRAGMQRHHLLPRQLLAQGWFARMADQVGGQHLGLDDFRANGLLLPALEEAAQVLGLPLHRGPHRHYNAVVMERVGQIEAGWQTTHLRDPEQARCELVMRLRLLQRALRRNLLQPARALARLNRHDPAWNTIDFSELDAMAEMLWHTSEVD